MVQEIIVYIIGVAVAVSIAVWLYRVIVNRKNPCSGCSGCDAKNLYEAKRKTCKPKGKSNCGCGCS